MKILITGSSGYIGSHLLIAASKEWPQALISVCDAKNGQDYSTLKGHEFNVVFHLGALATITNSVGLADKMLEVNALNLIPFLQNNKVNKFIFSSTGAVYGNRDTPAKEKDANWNSCLCPYSQSKFVAEGIIEKMCPNSVILRFGNVYGGDVKPRSEMLAVTHFLMDNPIVVYGGEQVRDFIHVNDVCKALIKSTLFFGHRIFNIAHGQSTRIGDLAQQFGKERKVVVIYKPANKEDVVRTMLDVTEARRVGLISEKVPVLDYRS